MKKALFLFLILFPMSAWPASVYVNSKLQTQVRENQFSQREVPSDVYLDTGVKELPAQGSFDVSLHGGRIFNINTNQFDLYQAVFKFKDIGDVIDVSGGRQFITPGLNNYLLDGLSLNIGKNDWPVKFGLIGGVPRFIESGDFHGNTGLVSGATVETNGISGQYSKLSVVYNKIKIGDSHWAKDETVLIGLTTSNRLADEWKPTLRGSFEYDAAGKLVDTGTVGFSFEPDRRVYFTLEGGHYNTNRQWTTPTIFSTFSAGVYYQGKASMAVTLDNVVLSGGYAYQRNKEAVGLSKNGNLADAGINVSFEPIALDVGLKYSFYDSFGGRAHDIYLALHDEPIDPLVIDAGINFTKYNKITNESDTGIATFLSSGVKIVKGLMFSAGGEFLRNNLFSKEFRANAWLTYNFEGTI